MPQFPLLQTLRQLLRAPVQRVMGPPDVAPVEFEAVDLAAQLVPEVYRPLSCAVGATRP